MELASRLPAESQANLQGALRKLQKINEQLLVSSSVVDNANNSVKQTYDLMSHTDTTGSDSDINTDNW